MKSMATPATVTQNAKINESTTLDITCPTGNNTTMVLSMLTLVSYTEHHRISWDII
jgi:hypothetical protein